MFFQAKVIQRMKNYGFTCMPKREQECADSIQGHCETRFGTFELGGGQSQSSCYNKLKCIMFDNSFPKIHLIQSLAKEAGKCGLYRVALAKQGLPGHEGKTFGKVYSQCLLHNLIFIIINPSCVVKAVG